MAKFPQVPAKIYVGSTRPPTGIINPKVNNIYYAFQDTAYDLVLISDSRVRMDPDALTDMADQMTEEVGLVQQMPSMYLPTQGGFPLLLEKVFFGTYIPRMFLPADLFRINTTTGMSILFRKALLTPDGLKRVGKYLGEDQLIARVIEKQKFGLCLSNYPALQNPSPELSSITTFNNRMIRWNRIRNMTLPLVSLGEPFSHVLPMGLLASFAAHFVLGTNPALVFVLYCSVMCALEYFLFRSFWDSSETAPCSPREFVLAWVFLEVNFFRIFFRSFWNPTIKWGTGRYRLRWGGTIQKDPLSTLHRFIV